MNINKNMNVIVMNGVKGIKDSYGKTWTENNKNRLNCVQVKLAFLHCILYPGCLSLKESFRKHSLKNKKHSILIKLEFLHFTLSTGFLSFEKDVR